MPSHDFDYESILDDPEPSPLGPAPDTRNASSGPPQRRPPSLASTDSCYSPRNSRVAPPRAGGTFSPPAPPPAFAPPPLNGVASQRSTRSNTLSSEPPNSVVKRKPLSPTASVIVARFSGANAHHNLERSQPPTPARISYISELSRYSNSSFSNERYVPLLASGTIQTTPRSYPVCRRSTPLTETTNRSLGQNQTLPPSRAPHNYRSSGTIHPTEAQRAIEPGHIEAPEPPSQTSRNVPQQTISETRYEEDDDDDDDSLYDSIYDNLDTTNATYPAVVEQQPSSPTLNPEQYDGAIETATTVKAIAVTPASTRTSKALAVESLHAGAHITPAYSKLGSFYWAASPSNTEFSSLPSPVSPHTTVLTDDTSLASSRTVTTPTAKPGANECQSYGNAVEYCETGLPTPPGRFQASETEIDEMEDELKGISAELAASIRREMDLEDLVERLQTEASSQAPGKRTSDYYSDSGVSSAKFSEYDQTREEVERIQRKSEQDKAQLRLELTNKLQDERDKRRDLDAQIRELSGKAAQVDAHRMNSLDASGRLKTLEETCEDLRRRLAEERDAKTNFEDLLGVLKGELQTASNERDNLRDEVVPQLRARVEGLENQAADETNLAYETTKMQQDLELLRQENDRLKRSREEAESKATRASMTLSRSSSVMAKPFRLQQAPAGLSRSNTTSKKPESKEALAERLRDVEAQRDALHSALKNLLERQEYQTRENDKRIKHLETERDRLQRGSPQKASYEKDVTNLRNEVSVLRRRAEDAMEQKWRVEKGLIGLKMDLDRAEEEMAMLRALLREKDILIPPMDADRLSNSGAGPVTSESVETAYKELQATYSGALERIRQLESNGTLGSDEKTQLAMKRLQLTLSSAFSEDGTTAEEALACKTQLEALMADGGDPTGTLADELTESAERVEQLAAQAKAQLDANTSLRQRLSDAVSRGEADRRSNTQRVTLLQDKLKVLEDQLVAAQSASEDRVTRHEAEISALRAAHSGQLSRLSGSLAPRAKSPLPSPMFPRSPRLAPQKTVGDDAEMSRLRDRVAELERAVAESDSEMQEVVARMSEAQIEVLTLQEERDGAVRETRRVRAAMEEEKMRGFEERFRSLTGGVGSP